MAQDERRVNSKLRKRRARGPEDGNSGKAQDFEQKLAEAKGEGQRSALFLSPPARPGKGRTTRTTRAKPMFTWVWGVLRVVPPAVPVVPSQWRTSGWAMQQGSFRGGNRAQRELRRAGRANDGLFVQFGAVRGRRSARCPALPWACGGPTLWVGQLPRRWLGACVWLTLIKLPTAERKFKG